MSKRLFNTFRSLRYLSKVELSFKETGTSSYFSIRRQNENRRKENWNYEEYDTTSIFIISKI